MTRIAAHPIRAGLALAAISYAIILAAIVLDEMRALRRDITAKRAAVQDVTHGSAVRFRGGS